MEVCIMNDIQIWPYGYTDDELYGYEIITWPDSQVIMEADDASDNAWLINDDEGLSLYGSCAYVVDVCWWNELNK